VIGEPGTARRAPGQGIERLEKRSNPPRLAAVDDVSITPYQQLCPVVTQRMKQTRAVVSCREDERHALRVSGQLEFGPSAMGSPRLAFRPRSRRSAPLSRR
jgi:hypothetical protein